tara:strand:- start:395 stop:787 length:393 start_codon:yes stop_codon:yes gene_type:complete
MKKKFFSKIIAKDNLGLQMISACCSEAKVKVGEIKYLSKNKIFLLFLERFNKEANKNNTKINSFLRFEYIDNVKSKNINQNNENLVLELVAIDFLKNIKNYEINLIFLNKACITLFAEIVEATLEDQNND